MATLCSPFEIASADGVIVVRVTLRSLVDQSALGDAEFALSACADFPESDVVVDLSAVEFVSSCGLGALLRVRRAVVARGGRVALRGLRDHVREVLLITRLNSLFALLD